MEGYPKSVPRGFDGTGETWRRAALCALVALCAAFLGCQSGSDPFAGVERAERSVAVERATPAGRGPAARPDGAVAMVDGEPISLAELAPEMLELAGSSVLRDAVLQRALRRRCEIRGIEISEADIDHEQTLLVTALRDAGVAGDEDDSARLLDELRQQRLLGPTRYRALLTRNAMLRALVQEDVDVSATAIDQAYQLRYGERYVVRLITSDTARGISEAREAIESGNSFADVATSVSTDVSRVRGGLLDPISVSDPSYPAAIRSVLPTLGVGEVSKPMVVDNGFALVLLESVIPEQAPDASDPEVDALLERDARRRQERLLMDEYARSTLAQTDVVILTEGLEKTWLAPETR